LIESVRKIRRGKMMEILMLLGLIIGWLYSENCSLKKKLRSPAEKKEAVK